MEWGGLGSGPGQFHEAASIVVYRGTSVFVEDGFNHRIQKFTLLPPYGPG